jgi:hypothetical protein
MEIFWVEVLGKNPYHLNKKYWRGERVLYLSLYHLELWILRHNQLL